MKSQNEMPAKKEYKAPNLFIYGKISEITQNITNTMTVDNPPGNMKT